MTTELDFDGRAAIVTGAGRGIGRETALGLARRGARVVVNDYGGARTALTAGTIDVAQAVVDEIQSAGGIAVADGSSVGSGVSAGAIVQHAMSHFGRIDILVNNAGGGLDGALEEKTDEEIEAQIHALLLGPYMLIRRAWPIMREQRFGRVVNMMSGALLGMELHTAYAAAKSGLIGLTNSAAFEGAPLGISVNGVWPLAFTRLAGELENRDPALFAWMQHFPPHLVAEAIVYLCSTKCAVTGEMFAVGGGRVGRVAIVSATGYRTAALTAEDLAAHLDDARDLSDAVVLNSAREEVARYPVDDTTPRF